MDDKEDDKPRGPTKSESDSREDSERRSERVGYGRPPTDGQFQAGVGGNPSGKGAFTNVLKRAYRDVAYKRAERKNPDSTTEKRALIELVAEAIVVFSPKDAAFMRLYLELHIEHARKLPTVPKRGEVFKTVDGAFFLEAFSDEDLELLKSIRDELALFRNLDDE